MTWAQSVQHFGSPGCQSIFSRGAGSSTERDCSLLAEQLLGCVSVFFEVGIGHVSMRISEVCHRRELKFAEGPSIGDLGQCWRVAQFEVFTAAEATLLQLQKALASAEVEGCGYAE